MVRARIRGVSLMSALLLITIVMIIATTMAGVFTMNMNITNRVSNGSVALSEAEAGLAEVLYQITRDENIEGDGNQENPKILWGTDDETIQATTTPGMQPDEAYHVVTFDTGSSFPHSTNNTALDNDSGYGGRVVPDGMLHIISTGYCKGQFRTIECVVEKPPFPFGLATSGKIDSSTPMRVLGTSSLAGYTPGEEDRPGHLLCNSSEGVTIGTKDGFETEISGFVKSTGQVDIEQPAVVRGGVRTFTEKTNLVDVNLQDFNLVGEPGVITLLDDAYSENQLLDVMYQYSGTQLHYQGNVVLQQAMLFIDGNLRIDGEVSGEGLIVVTGDVTLNSGTELRGTDKMALLAGGDITVDGEVDADGNSNYFSGLVYTEGNLNAKNITIVGNAVVNSQDSTKGNAILENVTVVSNEETGDMTITITSVSGAEDGYSKGIGAYSPSFAFGGVEDIDYDGKGASGSTEIGPDVPDEDLDFIFDNHLRDSIFGLTGDLGDLEGVPIPPPPGGADQYGFSQRFEDLVGSIQAFQVDIQTNNDLIDDLSTERSGLTPDSDPNDDDDEDQDRIDAINDQIDGLTADNDAAQAAAEELYNTTARQLLEDVRAQARLNSNQNGTVKTESGEGQTIIIRNERFNLNEYLPQSERVKMSFWKVYPRRM